jgi:hypothetical protein
LAKRKRTRIGLQPVSRKIRVLGPPLAESVQQIEIDGNRANWPNLQVGDRVIVRLFFPGESR